MPLHGFLPECLLSPINGYGALNPTKLVGSQRKPAMVWGFWQVSAAKYVDRETASRRARTPGAPDGTDGRRPN
jgi:hypothetical protein